MDPSLIINERIDVVAVFKKQAGTNLLCLPCKIKFRGRDIELVELGLHHLTSAGKRMIHVFDMSDGVNDYRLEFDAESLTWTLVAMIGGHHAGD
ncbi:MAG: hypothetical protein ACREF5_00385 [Candidatus Saccharimonadales bacterium]